MNSHGHQHWYTKFILRRTTNLSKHFQWIHSIHTIAVIHWPKSTCSSNPHASMVLLLFYQLFIQEMLQMKYKHSHGQQFIIWNSLKASHIKNKCNHSSTFEYIKIVYGLKFRTIQMELLWFVFISLAWPRGFGHRTHNIWHLEYEYRFDNEEKNIQISFLFDVIYVEIEHVCN